MSKIEEMAKKDAKYWCSTPGSEGSKEELVTIGFMRGANAVLEEIEKAIKECDVDGSPFVAILDKIKKLKQQ